MDRSFVVALAGGSAVVGGVFGALVTAWIARPSHASTVVKEAVAESRHASENAPLAARVSLIEQRIALLERRRFSSGVAPPASGQAPNAPLLPGASNAAGHPVVDDPVFEAAVRDVMERAEQERAGERDVQREERRKTQMQRWADELTPRIGLRDDQKQKLVQIALDYGTGLRKLWDSDAGAPSSREARFAQIREARGRSEQAVHQVLDAKQAADYDKLDDDMKIGARRFQPTRDR